MSNQAAWALPVVTQSSSLLNDIIQSENNVEATLISDEDCMIYNVYSIQLLVLPLDHKH